MFGRQKEIEILDGVLAKVIQNGPNLVLVEGEGGMGKSLLVEQFLSRTSGVGGCRVLRSTSLDPYNTDPYLTFKEIIQDIGMGDGPSTDVQELPTGSMVNVPLSLLGIRETPILDVPEPEVFTDRSKELVAQGRNQLYETVANKFVQVMGQSPLIVFIDNIQWISSSSIDLLQFIFQRLGDRPVMFIGALRTEDLDKDSVSGEYLTRYFERTKSEGRGVRIELGPLDREAMRSIVTLKLGLRKVPEEALDTIQTITGGHPLFVCEILDAVREYPKLWEEINSQEKGDLFHISVPKNMDAMVKAKIANLDDDLKNIVRGASVLGRNFDFDLLQKVLEVEEEALVDYIDQLLDSGFLVEVEGEEERYMFRRHIIQDVVYAEMSKARRRLIHRKAASALEGAGGPQGEGVFLLAEHSYKGRDFEAAYRNGLKAGDIAALAYAHTDAIRYYDIALQSLEKMDTKEKGWDQMAILVKKGENLDTIGKWTEAIETYKIAVAKALELKDLVTARRLYRDVGFLYMRRSNWAEAEDNFGSAMRLSRDSGDELGVAEAAFGIATVYYKKGAYPTAVEGYLGCTEMVEGLEGGERDISLAKFTRMLGAAYYRVGELDKAEDCFKKALDIYTRLDDRFEVGVTYHRLGMLFNQREEYQTAIDYFHKALDHFEKVGDVFHMSRNYINMGETFFNMGRVDEALENYMKAEEIDRRTDNRYGLAIALGLQGRVHIATGKYSEARTLLDENLQICEALGNKYGKAAAYRDIGILNFKEGNNEKASEFLDKSVTILKKIRSHEAEETEALLGMAMEAGGRDGYKGILERYQGTRAAQKAERRLKEVRS